MRGSIDTIGCLVKRKKVLTKKKEKEYKNSKENNFSQNKPKFVCLGDVILAFVITPDRKFQLTCVKIIKLYFFFKKITYAFNPFLLQAFENLRFCAAIAKSSQTDTRDFRQPVRKSLKKNEDRNNPYHFREKCRSSPPA